VVVVGRARSRVVARIEGRRRKLAGEKEDQMSCCHECEQSGMGCCGQSQYQLLGGLLERPLMGALVPAGTRFRLGMHITESGYFEEGKQRAIDDIRTCLLQSGVVNRYYLIQGRTTDSLGDTEALKNLIVGWIQACAVGVQSVDDVDSLIIDSIPAQYANQTGVQQPNYQDYAGQQNQNQGQKPKCEWSKMSFGNYMACQLGITDAIGGVTAGAAGALVGVGALTILAVVLLKR
jgi:hypothetical protein